MWWYAVMERGRWTCWFARRVGSTVTDGRGYGPCSSGLHAHHVAQRSTHPERRTDPTNGEVLCNHHHAWVHDHPALAEKLGLLERART